MTTTRGRPRLSLDEKRKKGTVHPGREKAYHEGTVKVVLLETLPAAPERLGDAGREHWETAVRELDKNKMLAACDLFLLEALCIEWEAYLDHRQLQKQFKSYYAITGDDGKPRSWQPHPVHYNGTNHLREYMRLCREFGFSPAARAKLGISAQEKTISKAASLLKSLGRGV